MGQYVRSQLGSCTAAGETVATCILRFFGFELPPAFVHSLRWHNCRSVAEGGILGDVGEIPIFEDQIYKIPNVLAPHSMPPSLITVVNEHGWTVNHNVSLTATVTAIS